MDILTKLEKNISSVIVGKKEAIEEVLAALLSEGHILIEDVPGVGKTYLARALAKSIDADFKRIQFTPDLLPTDVTGVSIYNQKDLKFEFQEGPVFTNILLADELNRATPRTQSALLECMQEKQVTVDGKTHKLSGLFFVMATQNPVEQQGVYNLPEAQLDRFLMQIKIGYPNPVAEALIIENQREKHPIEDIKSVAAISEITKVINEVKTIHVNQSVVNYIVEIINATRTHESILLGASPRASLALYRVCQAYALIKAKKFVAPDIVKKFAYPVLRHRLILQPQARLGGVTPDNVIENVLESIRVPVKLYD